MHENFTSRIAILSPNVDDRSFLASLLLLLATAWALRTASTAPYSWRIGCPDRFVNRSTVTANPVRPSSGPCAAISHFSDFSGAPAALRRPLLLDLAVLVAGASVGKMLVQLCRSVGG